uniref:DUF2799 domain-containing protein n=1 Tax=Thaumasiovibrio occultus TaxID=1891184 RepID=UPI000B355C85|nr:DUF2799 domain-containing protein [Thaumasiovibrio occultus]
MKALLSGLTLCASFLITGCASAPDLSQIDDFHAFGEAQGRAGKPRISKAEFGDKPYDEYRDGYQSGLTVYCAQDGFTLGAQGVNYYDICDEINPAFSTGYYLGFMEWQMSQSDSDNPSYIEEENTTP